jgi:hypothetical protein
MFLTLHIPPLKIEEDNHVEDPPLTEKPPSPGQITKSTWQLCWETTYILTHTPQAAHAENNLDEQIAGFNLVKEPIFVIVPVVVKNRNALYTKQW